MNQTTLEMLKDHMQRQDAELKEAFAPLAEHTDVQFGIDSAELEAIAAAARPATPAPLTAVGGIRC